ncbi:Collagenase precursor [Fulvivirga imtechensis AK7]|uniref:Collagenase n=1 Tax=Fulvivirga imtechensis AK7 TaxID=1237149 RepID=L8K1Y0_9BACT|nr:peptidase U32 family protein [Fulvivirga imtechensis]ELR73467.1 Collagenase precursor [Fulvivirga imtechensis AK7]
MSNHWNNVEVMAPAGSFESLSAALKAGADAIYFGVEQLNMRARSSNNFTLEDIEEVSKLCRDRNVRSYLTLNTVIYDHDLNLVRSIATAAKIAGISAIIASDHAVMAYAKKIGMPVHISTQANICNIETVEFYVEYADVMVLARELTLSQTATIIREIERRQITGPSGKLVEIEIFAHGALCMAVSGKCYLSLHSHYASANRGACIQNCRREYIVTDKEEGIELEIDNEYIMSAKDLCTINFLDQVINSGVKVLKIEGRGRAADYVYTTTRCYKEAVAAINSSTYTQERIEAWKNQLATVFNRGFWDGYYLGKKMGEWSDSYGSKATERKVFLGTSVKYFSKLGVGEFQIETQSLKKGNKILITGPKTGIVQATVTELRVEDQPVETVSKGIPFSMPLPEAVRPNDKLYKIVSNS